jgi:hypothetical protein
LRSGGKPDRLLSFSRPLTGSFWFAPSLAQFRAVVD